MLNTDTNTVIVLFKVSCIIGMVVRGNYFFFAFSIENAAIIAAFTARYFHISLLNSMLLFEQMNNLLFQCSGFGIGLSLQAFSEIGWQHQDNAVDGHLHGVDNELVDRLVTSGRQSPFVQFSRHSKRQDFNIIIFHAPIITQYRGDRSSLHKNTTAQFIRLHVDITAIAP